MVFKETRANHRKSTESLKLEDLGGIRAGTSSIYQPKLKKIFISKLQRFSCPSESVKICGNFKKSACHVFVSLDDSIADTRFEVKTCLRRPFLRYNNFFENFACNFSLEGDGSDFLFHNAELSELSSCIRSSILDRY